MTQYIVTHIDGSKLNLHSRAKGTYVESAKFRPRWQSYAELTLEITAYTAPEWAYFDRIVVDDTPVFLHEWNEAQHIDNKGTKYILHFYGVEKMLFEASPFLDIDSAGAYISKDKPPIVGNLELFGNVLCNCINYRAFNTTTGQRYKQNTIKLGTCPAGTKHLLVSTTEYNAFAALLAVCSAFKTHYTITINPAGDTDYLLNFGVAPGVYAPLAYGRGKGLYRLDRKSISNENVKTILTVLGSSKNLPQGYGKQRLELDETLYPGSIIADNDKIQTFGAWNDVYIAEDIMPEYRGEILGVDTEDKYTFYCELDDFDPTGGTLNMLTGNLAGSNFRIAAFNAASGKITVEELIDSSGFAVPSVAPYIFATGDTFTIVDIPMPQAYIEIAQQALAEAGQARYLEVSQPRVAYNVALHSRFVKSHGSRPRVGMYFPITDTRYGVNKAVQCVTLERNLLAQDEYEYTNCEVADNVVETLGAKIYKQSKEAQALLKHLGATHLTTPTSSLQGTVRTAQAAAVAAAEAVAALEAEAARIAAEAYADGILSNEEAARIADVAAKLTEAKQYAAAQAAAAESAAKTYAEGQAAAAQAAAEAVAAAEAEAAELAANAYADGIVDAEEARAIAEAAAKLTEAKNHANTQAAAAEAAANTYSEAQAEAARLAAIASAKTYTDTEVTAAKGYADSTAAAAQSAAEAYALARANLAETNAEAYADGIVDAEEAARIAEATAKLNEAKTYAETKASEAQTAAQQYAATAASNAQSAAESYALAKANLAETTAKAYADGVVSDEEARAIADATAKMNEAKAHAETKATEAKNAAEAAAALDATAKANAAKSAAETYALAKANLAETTAKAYADGIVDAEEARAIADATAKANAAKAAAEATAAALDDAIQIGGRNYWAVVKNAVLTSYLKYEGDYVFSNNTSASAFAMFRMDTLNVPLNNQYTITFEIKVTNENIQFINNVYYVNSALSVQHNKPQLIVDEWVKVEASFYYAIEDTSYTHIYINGATGINQYKIRNFNLKQGNKATDWTPAPEDVQAEIDAAAAAAVTTASNDATTKMNAAKDAIAQEAGYTNFADMASKAALTVNGLLNSNIINTDQIFADKLLAFSAFIDNLTVRKLLTPIDSLNARVEIKEPTTADPYARITIWGADASIWSTYARMFVESAADSGQNSPSAALEITTNYGTDTSTRGRLTVEGIEAYKVWGKVNPATSSGLSSMYKYYGMIVKYKSSGGEYAVKINITYNKGTGTIDFILDGLPTANPGGSITVWKDSKGFLRIGAAVAYTAADVGAVPTTRKVNNKALSADISLIAADVGAAAASHTHTPASIGALPDTTIQYFTQAQWAALTQAQKDAVPLALVQE